MGNLEPKPDFFGLHGTKISSEELEAWVTKSEEDFRISHALGSEDSY